ncbi:MAG: hypothetical protein CBC42_06240 [Betaproteobacteria bacterium TMED82]|nr:MAG: hypothetical protein CBC42_06240 [Betaproteobacteria bacterium TMED82]|tara:strand:+ start:88247 stop:89089 length:843 start_codon:yes stop_codon:yes gene_type:complete
MKINLLLFSLFCFSISLFLTGCTVPKPAPVESRPVSKVKKPSEALYGKKKNASADGFYTVESGDTLFGIALAFGQNWRDIAAWNGLSNPNKILKGQRLKVVPPKKVSEAIAIPLESQSSVREGEQQGMEVDNDDKVVKVDKLDDEDTLVDMPTEVNPNNLLSWVWPANGQVIEQFSESNSKGISIAGLSGESIFAVSDGKVVYSGNGLRGYGNLVILKHSGDMITAYAHNQIIFVKEGEQVSKGQKIAEMGMTEAERPKLLFEVRKSGKPLDPLQFLPPR